MAKKEEKKNKKVESPKEVKPETKKEKTVAPKSKKERKEALKKAKAMEFEAMVAEKKSVDEKIKKLAKEKKNTKDKKVKKELASEIKELKYQRSRIGKQPSFLGDVREEMHLVRWPSKMEVVKYSLACLIFVAFFALFFFGMDALFALVKDLIG